MLLTGNDLLQTIQSTRSILVWGPAITGKTYSLWTLVKWLKDKNLGPLHHYDFDSKSESLVLKCQAEGILDHLVVHKFPHLSNRINPAIAPNRDPNLFMHIISDINKHYDNIDPQTGSWKSGHEVGAIASDSLSSLNDIIFDFVMNKLGHEPSAPNTDFRSDSVKVMAKIEEYIETVNSLPCISLLTAHEQYTKDDVQGSIFNLPKVLGKHSLAPSLARRFNIVMFSDGGNDKYQWLVRPNAAKSVRSAGMTSRIDKYPPAIEQDYRLIL